MMRKRNGTQIVSMPVMNAAPADAPFSPPPGHQILPAIEQATGPAERMSMNPKQVTPTVPLRQADIGWQLGWGTQTFVADSQRNGAHAYDITMENLGLLCGSPTEFAVPTTEVSVAWLHNLLTLVTIASTHEMILMQRLHQLDPVEAEKTARNLATLCEAGDSYGELLHEYGEALVAGKEIR
jgi:hypothetical protein